MRVAWRTFSGPYFRRCTVCEAMAKSQNQYYRPCAKSPTEVEDALISPHQLSQGYATAIIRVTQHTWP